MSGETYREEHDWIPDALAHVRWVVRCALEREHATVADLRSLEDVVTRLARELEVTPPRDPFEDTPKETEDFLRNLGWTTVDGVEYQRLTGGGKYMWLLDPQTGNRSEGWWTLRLRCAYWGADSPKVTRDFSVQGVTVRTAVREANQFVDVFHAVPSDSPWSLVDYIPARLVRHGDTPGPVLWTLEERPGVGWHLSYPGTQSGWVMTADTVPECLEEADGVISRWECAWDPRTSGEDD